VKFGDGWGEKDDEKAHVLLRKGENGMAERA